MRTFADELKGPITNTEIDELIARRIFGKGEVTHAANWVYGTAPSDGYGEFSGWWCRTCHGDEMPAIVRGGSERPNGERHYNYHPVRYTLDWNHTFQLVEYIKGNITTDPPFELTANPDGTWDVSFGSAFVYDEKEPQRAICLAALRFAGAELDL